MPVTHYIWDEVNDTLLMEKDEAGNIIAEYTHEPAQYGPLISQRRNGQTRYHHFDGQGSTRALTDESGAVTDTYTYTAFGEPVASSGTTTNPFGYKGALGYYVNPETNDLYVRARTYEPAVCRWISLDPLGFFDHVNRYSYASNSPVSFGDPSGEMRKADECCCCHVWGGGVTKIDPFKDPTGVFYSMFGHRWEFEVSLIYPVLPGGDCKLEWWEYTTEGYKSRWGDGLPAGQWKDMAPSHLKSNPTFKDWRKRKFQCPGVDEVQFRDDPTINLYPATVKPPNRLRYLWIAVRVLGTCPEDPGKLEIFIEQRLTSRNYGYLQKESYLKEVLKTHLPPGLPW